jgi:hypothetical protein
MSIIWRVLPLACKLLFHKIVVIVGVIVMKQRASSSLVMLVTASHQMAEIASLKKVRLIFDPGRLAAQRSNSFGRGWPSF